MSDNELLEIKYIKSFLNKIILNFKKEYILEIGIKISDKEISIFYRTENNTPTNQFYVEWNTFYKENNSFKYFLKQNGISLRIVTEANNFKECLIKELNNYYFKPEKTKNRYIFKYMPFSKNAISSLVNSNLWFASASTFNDPYDCRYKIDAEINEESVMDFYFRNAKKEKFLNEEILLSVEEFAKTYIPRNKNQFLKDLENHHYHNSVSKKIGICSFSESYNNRLMWAHYADNSTGICLIFDLESDECIFNGGKVKYRSSLPKKFYDGLGVFEVTDVIFTKNSSWKYEREIRELIYLESDNRLLNFGPKSLVGIITGPNISRNDNETIINLVNQLEKYNLEIIGSKVNLDNNKLVLYKNNLKLK